MLRKSSFAGILGLLAWAPLAVADTLPAVADSQVNLTAVAAKGGTLATVTVKNAAPGPSYRGFAKFDLNALPYGLQVSKATLRLWTSLVTSEGVVEIAAVLGPWEEANLTAVVAPDLSTTVRTFSVTKAQQKTYVNADVTQLVRDWMSGTLTNHGLALLGGTDDVNVRFDSKENGQTSHPMELEVILAPGTGDITGVYPSYGGGLTGGGSVGDVYLGVDPTLFQRRIATACSPGYSIRAIDVNGGATCDADDVGTSVQVSSIAGVPSEIPGGSNEYVFVGPTQTVTLSQGQRVTGSAEAPLGLTSGTVTIRLGLCYQSTSGGTVNNFVNSASYHYFTSLRDSYSAAASVVLNAGTYRLGMCVFNNGSAAISNNGAVNGWFMVTN